jgi:hypothetical protein
MCATTDLPPTGVSTTAGAPKADGVLSLPPPTQRSSFLTPISIKHHSNTAASEGALLYHDSSTASLGAHVPHPHQRRPSVVQSDFGVEDDIDHCSNGSDHAANQNFCAQIVLLPSALCQGDQLDIFMACRHPLEILGMHSHAAEGEVDVITHQLPHANQHIRRNNKNDDHESCPSSNRVSGYHAIPINCEYCGSPDISNCHPGCQRPQSFFPKRRPPFSPKGDGSIWDEKDYYMVLVNNNNCIGHDVRGYKNKKNGAYARADKRY